MLTYARRFAAHGYSPRCANPEGIQRTFDILRSVEGRQSDNITKVYKIQDAEEKWLSIPADKADCHVEETEILNVYVSKNTKRHHVCITTELPRRLLGHLGVAQDDLVNKLGAILLTRSLDDVDELLDRYGIINPGGVSRSDCIEMTSTDSDLYSTSLPSPGIRPAPFSRDSTPGATSPAHNLSSSSESGSPLPRSPSVESGPRTGTPEAPLRTEDSKEQYKRLIGFMRSASRQSGLSTLPGAGAISRSSIDPPSDLLLDNALSAPNRRELDKDKIGAAGELLVSATEFLVTSIDLIWIQGVRDLERAQVRRILLNI